MIIKGSPAFKDQVNEALALWESVDSNALELEKSIAYIKETNDYFKARTYPDGGVHITREIAFWPNTSHIIQQRILASYIAHESVHAWCLAQGSDKWKDEVEQIALDYQADIASKLGISDVYVSNPIQTIESMPVEETIQDVVEIDIPRPLAVLIGITLAVLAFSKVITGKTKRRSLLSRF